MRPAYPLPVGVAYELGVEDDEEVVLLATEVGYRTDQLAEHLDRGVAEARHHSDGVALLALSMLDLCLPLTLATCPSGVDYFLCHALAPLLVGG